MEERSPASCRADRPVEPCPRLPLRRIAGSCAWSFIDYGGGRLLSFAAVVYIARIMGAAAFGVYSVSVAFAQTAAVFVESGTTSYGGREIAQRSDHQRIVSSITYLRFVTALLVTAVSALIIWLVPPVAKYRFALLAACGYLAAVSLARDWYYSGLALFRPIAVANLCRGMAVVVGCVLLVKGPADLLLAIAMYAAAPLIGTAILAGHSYWKLHVNPLGKPRLSDVISSGRQSIAFAGISLGAALYGVIPLYVLAWLGSMEQVGIFSAAQRPVVIAASTVMPLAASFYPLICENHRNPDKFRASQSLFQHAVLILTVPIVVLAVTNGGYIISLLYGNGYPEACVPFRLMSLVIPLSALRLTFSHPLLAGHRQGVAAANAFKAAGAMALLACALVLRQGAIGAAWATVTGEALFTALSAISARRLFSVPLLPPGCRPIALAACAMTVPALLPGPRMVWISVSAGVFSAIILAYDDLAKEVSRTVANRLLKYAAGGNGLA